MKTKLFAAVLCPSDVEPSEDNVFHFHVVSSDIVQALDFTECKFPDRNIVSISYVRPVHLPGTLVDFE